jgi:hypothetical protein
MPISSTGFWVLSETDFEKEHAHDPSLAKALCEICPTKRVYDFGCGPGNYVRDMRAAGIESTGYDGNPVTGSFPNCHVADLTNPSFRMDPTEFVMCLEVGEHVPKEYETALWETLDHHVLPGGMLVLSWAVPGQGGYGHVNCQTNDYVRGVMTSRGYDSVYHLEHKLRSRCSLSWFKDTIMVFRKRPTLHTDLAGGLGNQLFKVCNLQATGERFCLCNEAATPHSTTKYTESVFPNFNTTCSGASRHTDCLQQNYSAISAVLPDVLAKLHIPVSPDVDAAFLHIRGGDYVGHPLHFIPLDGYYERAIQHFAPDTLFYIFTNDRQYAESFAFLQNIRHEFVECDEVDGLSRMKHCTRGGICANSSYSWWGAVLDIHRTLVIPSRWTWDTDWNAKSDYRFPGAIVEDVPLDIYCIHLPHRLDRFQHIESLRTRYPSLRIHIVDAIRDTNGVRGCVLSHKKIVADAKSRNLPSVIVIEDDCDFLLPEKQLVDSLLTSISRLSTVDIVNGCGNLPTLTATRVDSLNGTTFLKSSDVRTTHCMLYGASSYERVLSFSEETAIDIQTNSLNMVFTYPYLATQLPSYSDIAKLDVSYENIEKSRAFVQNILEAPPPRQSIDERINPIRIFRIPIRTNRM